MRIPRTLDKLFVVARRDLLTSIRHRNGLMVLVAGVAAELAGFYYLAQAIGPGFRPDGLDYYSFLLIGSAMYGFVLGGMATFVLAVQEAQVTGTMEVLFTSSTPPQTILCLSAFSAFAARGMNVVLYLLIGILICGVKVHASILGVVAVISLSLVIAIALGILGAAVQIAMQKGMALVWLLGVTGGLLTGSVFPVSSLPPILRKLALLMPLTPAIQGLRVALLRGGSLSSLSNSLLWLIGFALVLLPLSLLLFSRVLRTARLRGTLSFY